MADSLGKEVKNDMTIWLTALASTRDRALEIAENIDPNHPEADAELYMNIYAATQVLRGVKSIKGRDWDELQKFNNDHGDGVRIIRNMLTHYDNWYSGSGHSQVENSPVFDLGGATVRGANVPFDYTRAFVIKIRDATQPDGVRTVSANYQVGRFSNSLIKLANISMS